MAGKSLISTNRSDYTPESLWLKPPTPIPGTCGCGCGSVPPFPANPEKHSVQKRNTRLRFVPGHHNRLERTSRHGGGVPVLVDDRGCWNWTRGLNAYGYGVFSSKGEYHYAHVFFFVRATGDDRRRDLTWTLDHLCRNRRCVNPNHLEWVTRGENVRRGHRSRKNNRTKKPQQEFF